MKVAWMIVGLFLNAAHLSMGQSVALPQQPSASTPAITGSTNINPSNSASVQSALPTTKPAIVEPTQPSPLPPQGAPILCSDQTVYASLFFFSYRIITL
ncbi:hypothetical protein BC941DRAFT_415937 [Chlamydoabsidia padenii]|nr:hypothetical protein BC941DRAFT_415937 [Chlamydoabsidia padenii]